MIFEEKGSHLTGKNAENNSLIKILNEGEKRESNKFKYEDGSWQIEYVFKVSCNGKEYQMRMNKASRVAMIEAYGKDTKDWVGKEACIRILPTPKGDTKMIILDPVKTVNQQAKDLGWIE